MKKRIKLEPYWKESDGWTKMPNISIFYIKSPSAFKVYLYLCSKCNEQSNATASFSQISKDCKISISTVQGAIRNLEELGLIEKIKTDKNRYTTATTYHVRYVNEDEDYFQELNKKKVKRTRKKSDRDKYAYQKWRKSVLQRDDYECQCCGIDDDRAILHTHHIKKFSDNEDLRYDVDNGITLCHHCHSKTYRREEEFEEYFLNIIMKHK